MTLVLHQLSTFQASSVVADCGEATLGTSRNRAKSAYPEATHSVLSIINEGSQGLPNEG